MARIAVAMSGGVDSSVAAALLQRDGHELLGFTMRLGSPAGEAGWEATKACCGLSEIHDARRVADLLDIPHYVLNHAAAFEAAVIDDFLDEYAAGRTPNPCVRCNQFIKFATFLEQARAFGCSHVASGHYARVDQAPTGRWRLQRGVDPTKDQAYVLHSLTQEQLGASLFPLGGRHKREVRALAAELGLPTATKHDSQEICFVDGNYGEFVAARRPTAARPGPIVGPDGRHLGEHRGIAWYTVGQRKGLGLGTSEPYFVSEIRAAENTLVVATAQAAGRDTFTVAPVTWVALPAPEPAAGGASARLPLLDATVQVRYRMQAVACRVESVGSRVQVRLAEPLRGIAPGQSAVVYDPAGYVLLGGPIDRVAAPESDA